jgi:hypothetical protein
LYIYICGHYSSNQTCHHNFAPLKRDHTFYMATFSLQKWWPNKMVTPVTTLGFGVKRHFKQYFSYIVAVSFLGVASHWKTISHNVVSSTPRLSCKSNYHTITITTVPEMNNIKIAYLISNGPTNCKMSDNNLNISIENLSFIFITGK